MFALTHSLSIGIKEDEIYHINIKYNKHNLGKTSQRKPSVKINHSYRMTRKYVILNTNRNTLINNNRRCYAQYKTNYITVTFLLYLI